MAKILIVEDDAAMATALRDGFAFDGHAVTVAKDGVEGLRLAIESSPDVVVLDVMLPRLSGLDVCKKIRAKGSDVPVIMLTARGQEIDKVVGLRSGADDYVTKPFGVGELVARIRAALRRAVRLRNGERVLLLDDASIDLEKRRVLRGGAEIRLTPIEFRLVAVLARHAGRVVTHRQLLREVWGPTHENDTHYLRIYVKQLRDKLESDPANPRHFVTELGVGYRLELAE